MGDGRYFMFLLRATGGPYRIHTARSSLRNSTLKYRYMIIILTPVATHSLYSIMTDASMQRLPFPFGDLHYSIPFSHPEHLSPYLAQYDYKKKKKKCTFLKRLCLASHFNPAFHKHMWFLSESFPVPWCQTTATAKIFLILRPVARASNIRIKTTSTFKDRSLLNFIFSFSFTHTHNTKYTR